MVVVGSDGLNNGYPARNRRGYAQQTGGPSFGHGECGGKLGMDADGGGQADVPNRYPDRPRRRCGADPGTAVIAAQAGLSGQCPMGMPSPNLRLGTISEHLFWGGRLQKS